MYNAVGASLEDRSKLQRFLSIGISQLRALQRPKAHLRACLCCWLFCHGSVTDAQSCFVAAGNFQKTLSNAEVWGGQNTESSANGRSISYRNAYCRDSHSLHPHWGVLRRERCRDQPRTNGGVRRALCAAACHLRRLMIPCSSNGATVFTPGSACLNLLQRSLADALHTQSSTKCLWHSWAPWWALSLNKGLQPQIIYWFYMNEINN